MTSESRSNLESAIVPASPVPVTSSALRTHLVNCGLVALAVLAATVLRLALAPLVGPAVPFITFFIGTIVLAWYRGFWPAAISLPISAWIGARYVLTPGAPMIFSPNRSDEVALFGFVLTGLAVSFLIDFQRRTLKRAQTAEYSQSIVARENARLLKQAESVAEELRQSNDDLKRANRDLELFAYSASHDLREPLRTISLAAQALERKRPPGYPVTAHASELDFVNQILMASRNMESLMQDILTYISTAQEEMEPASLIDVNRVLADVLGRMHALIAESGAIVTHDELPPIAMHEHRLAQVLQNLIANAIKYRGADPPTIHIEARLSEQLWIVSVIDNGIGIDKKFSAQIFGLFKRLHPQSEYQGSGMGLAICQRIVEQYGGRIWLADSVQGKGSTFCFSVPAAAATNNRSFKGEAGTSA